MNKGLFQRKVGIFEIGIFLVSFCLTGILLQIFTISWWFYLILIPVMLVGLHYYQRIGSNKRILLVGMYFGVTARSILRIARIIVVGTVHPPEWDFLTVWLSARIAHLGQDIYVPKNYLNYVLPIKVGQDFINEYLRVGFSFPPPTILLFYPLGWFEKINYAYVAWQLLMVAVIGVCIYLLWKLFLDQQSIVDLSAVLALALLFSGTYATLDYAQTNFLVLLVILLYIIYVDSFSAGLWLAIGFLIKPYVALLYIFLALKRQWRTIIGSIATYSSLLLITVILFGPDILQSYLIERPMSKLPDSVYSESVNQSLLAQIIRLTHYDFSGKSPLSNPLYIVLTLLLLITTCILTYLIRKDDAILAFTLTLLTALLVYPGTLTHYSVLLFIPVFVLWKYRKTLPYGLVTSVSVITITYLLAVGNYNHIFIAIVLNWIVFSAICCWEVLSAFRDSKYAGQVSPTQ